MVKKLNVQLLPYQLTLKSITIVIMEKVPRGLLLLINFKGWRGVFLLKII